MKINRIKELSTDTKNLTFDLRNRINDLINDNSCINRDDVLLDIFLELHDQNNFTNYFLEFVETENNVFILELIREKLFNEVLSRKGAVN